MYNGENQLQNRSVKNEILRYADLGVGHGKVEGFL